VAPRGLGGGWVECGGCEWHEGVVVDGAVWSSKRWFGATASQAARHAGGSHEERDDERLPSLFVDECDDTSVERFADDDYQAAAARVDASAVSSGGRFGVQERLQHLREQRQASEQAAKSGVCELERVSSSGSATPCYSPLAVRGIR